MTNSHQTAPTQFVSAGETRFAYRRFGKSDSTPLLMNMHFTGTMDHWDPSVVDGLASEREVILFNNSGISSSTGTVPASVELMASDAIQFVGALGLQRLDVLGFSLGGLIAQEIARQASNLVRKLVLVGTGPRSGVGMASLTPEAQRIFGAEYENPDELWAHVHFTESAESQAKAKEFLQRFRMRVEGRDPQVGALVAPAQLEALAKWGAESVDPFRYLEEIAQPTLVVNGDHDVIIYTENSLILQKHLPNAQLILFPDASHGSQYQYPEAFVGYVNAFLNS